MLFVGGEPERVDLRSGCHFQASRKALLFSATVAISSLRPMPVSTAPSWTAAVHIAMLLLVPQVHSPMVWVFWRVWMKASCILLPDMWMAEKTSEPLE